MAYSMPVAAPLLLLLLVAPPSLAAEAPDEASAAASVQSAMPEDVSAPSVGNGSAGNGSAGDPWEGMNRRVFAFNEGLDRFLLEPVATGWDYAVPEVAQKSVGNFFDHLALPVRFANDLLQGKPWKAYETAWRIVINSVVGIGGLFDPATRWQVYKSDEDFGQTLGVWGVPPGPYWVIPVYGASSPRDAAGMLVDRTASAGGFFVPIYVSASAGVLDVVNDRAAVLEDIRAERESAFDFYTFVRSSYTQFRENRVRDRAEQDEEDGADDDLYYLDEEDDDA